MKNYFLLIFAILLATHGFSQNYFYKGNNVLMPSNLVVSSTIPMFSCLNPNNGNCSDDDIAYSIENNIVKDIFNILTNATLKNGAKVYNPNSKALWLNSRQKKVEQIDVKEILLKLGQKEEYVESVDSLGFINTRLVQKDFDIAELFGFKFYEDWFVSEKPFAISKKVLGYSPIRKYYEVDDSNSENPKFSEVFLVLDTINLEVDLKLSNSRMILCNKIRYEHLLYSNFSFVDINNKEYQNYVEINDMAKKNNYILTQSSAPYFNEAGIYNFIKLIVNKSVNQNYPVYDYYHIKSKLTPNEILESLDASIDSLKILDIETNTIKIKTLEKEPDLMEIKSILFEEEWYIDPLTLRMNKKVVSISPVRWYYKEEDVDMENVMKRVVFTMFFDVQKKSN